MALLPLSEARRQVLDGVLPLETEDVGLVEACGRTLAADAIARRTQPPDDVSAMDGYAFRHTNGLVAPLRLGVVGTSAAGRPFDGQLRDGEAVRIFTGAVMPAGADTVVMQEDCVADGGAVILGRLPDKGRHARVRGLDFREGDGLIARGRLLGVRDIALAAAMNLDRLRVHRRPRVAMFSTGDELVEPGAALRAGQIVSSNALALAVLLAAERCEVFSLGIVPDRLDPTVDAVKRARALDADVLVTAGGASVGDHDLVQKALRAEGFDPGFWRIAVRPGRPLIFGRLGRMRVLGLPGNPVSAYVCALLFLVPLVRALAGRQDTDLPRERARLGADMAANDERADFVRATLAEADGDLPVATPFPVQDSSMMRVLAQAQCCIVRSPHDPPARAGDPCDVIRLP